MKLWRLSHLRVQLQLLWTDLLGWERGFGVNDAYSRVYTNSPRETNLLTWNSLTCVPPCCYFPFWASTSSPASFPDFHCTFCSVKDHFPVPHRYFILTCSHIWSAILSTGKVLPVTIKSCTAVAVSSVIFFLMHKLHSVAATNPRQKEK